MKSLKYFILGFKGWAELTVHPVQLVDVIRELAIYNFRLFASQQTVTACSRWVLNHTGWFTQKIKPLHPDCLNSPQGALVIVSP